MINFFNLVRNLIYDVQKVKIMRKLFTVATLFMFVAMGCMNAQNQGKRKIFI